MTSKYLGSWWSIIGVWVFCIAWLFTGLPVDWLTFALSVVALSFSQIILRDTSELTARQDEKLDAIIHGTDADDSVADS
jgi:FtsH-binding integral membrane protein